MDKKIISPSLLPSCGCLVNWSYVLHDKNGTEESPYLFVIMAPTSCPCTQQGYPGDPGAPGPPVRGSMTSPITLLFVDFQHS